MDDWCAVSDSLVWEVSMSPPPPPSLARLSLPLFQLPSFLFPCFQVFHTLCLFSNLFKSPSSCFHKTSCFPFSTFSVFSLSETWISLPFKKNTFIAFLYVLFSSSYLCHILPPKLLCTQWLVCLSVAKSSWLSLCCTLQISNIPCTVWYDVSHCRLTKSLWILYNFLESLLERSA